MRYLAFVIGVSALVVDTASWAASPPDVPAAYLHATLIDPARGVALADAALVVRGSRIEAVGPAGEVSVPAGARIADLRGRFLIPGLINSHVHLATGRPEPALARAYLRRELYSGVTTVRDMADDARMLAELARESTEDEIESPDLYYPALMAGPSFFADPRTQDASRGFEPGSAPWMRAVTEQSDLRQVIAEARGTGAIAIKIYDSMTRELITALTAEAHRQGLLVWSHATVFPAGPQDIADAGVDVMSHAMMLAYQANARIPPSYAERTPLDEHGDMRTPSMLALYRTMVARGIILDATIDAYYHGLSARYPPALGVEITRAAHEAHVLISVGTDDDADWSDPQSALFVELDRLVRQAGLSPMEALAAATVVGAQTVGRAGTLGRLAPGFVANFVVLRRNPLSNIRNARTVEVVVKRGVSYRADRYRPYHGPTRAH
ncbi:MAG: amidohydrolase family protein [Proteobacteria bacterium]|nr:amidohydrolase family protein [Pseudomonadota bacterium]